MLLCVSVNVLMCVRACACVFACMRVHVYVDTDKS